MNHIKILVGLIFFICLSGCMTTTPEEWSLSAYIPYKKNYKASAGGFSSHVEQLKSEVISPKKRTVTGQIKLSGSFQKFYISTRGRGKVDPPHRIDITGDSIKIGGATVPVNANGMFEFTINPATGYLYEPPLDRSYYTIQSSEEKLTLAARMVHKNLNKQIISANALLSLGRLDQLAKEFRNYHKYRYGRSWDSYDREITMDVSIPVVKIYKYHLDTSAINTFTQQTLDSLWSSYKQVKIEVKIADGLSRTSVNTQIKVTPIAVNPPPSNEENKRKYKALISKELKENELIEIGMRNWRDKWIPVDKHDKKGSSISFTGIVGYKYKIESINSTYKYFEGTITPTMSDEKIEKTVLLAEKGSALRIENNSFINSTME